MLHITWKLQTCWESAHLDPETVNKNYPATIHEKEHEVGESKGLSDIPLLGFFMKKFTVLRIKTLFFLIFNGILLICHAIT